MIEKNCYSPGIQETWCSPTPISFITKDTSPILLSVIDSLQSYAPN
jgi:hypothetical protein